MIGAKLADLTINELYDKPQLEGGNILWGCDYFFVREEFDDARAHRFRKKLDTILLAFGGTDQHDLSGNIFHAIKDICIQHRIRIHIVP